MSKSLNNDYIDEKDVTPRKKKAWNAKRAAVVDREDEDHEEVRKDVNTLVIGSRSITLKPISLDKVGALVGKKLSSVRHSHPEDQPAHYAIVNNAIWILTGQSHVNFDSNKAVTYLGDDVDEVTFGTLPVVYCRDSKIKSGQGLGVCDQNIFINSRLTSQTAYLKNVRQVDSTVNAPDFTANSVLVKDSYLSAQGTIALNRSSLDRISFGGMEIIDLKCAMLETQSAGGEYKSITVDGGDGIRNFAFRIGTCMTKRHVELTVKKRIDYGHFSAAQPVHFIRANGHGMVVNGVYTDFDMHTRFVEKFKADIGETTCLSNALNGSYDASVNQEDYLDYIRFIHDMAFGQQDGRYIPDRYNAIENNMMLGLMEQIRSRLNLYKQLSVLDNNC